jgi:hypothetical protein
VKQPVTGSTIWLTSSLILRLPGQRLKTGRILPLCSRQAPPRWCCRDVLGINLVAGRSQPSQSPDANHRLVRALLSQFEAKFGTTACERLIGCRLDTPEGQRFFKENKLRETKCQVFTKEAARMASATLEQEAKP